MIRTPLGDLEIQIDGKLTKYQATLMPIEGAFSELDGRYKIVVSLQPDGVQYQILPSIQTAVYRFGVAWITGCTKDTTIQTWLGVDPA